MFVVDQNQSSVRPVGPPWRSIFRALATGLFGTIVLSLFLQNFLQDQILAGLLPIITAFNAAVAGYTLAKHRMPVMNLNNFIDAEQDTTARYLPAATGGFSALLSLGALSLLGFEALAGEFFGWVLLLVACLGSVIFGAMGSWIAVKQAKLSEAKA